MSERKEKQLMSDFIKAFMKLELAEKERVVERLNQHRKSQRFGL